MLPAEPGNKKKVYDILAEGKKEIARGLLYLRRRHSPAQRPFYVGIGYRAVFEVKAIDQPAYGPAQPHAQAEGKRPDQWAEQLKRRTT